MLKMIPAEEFQIARTQRAFNNRNEYWVRFGEFYSRLYPPESHLSAIDAIRIAVRYLRKKGKLVA
jgi:hypothetical protein